MTVIMTQGGGDGRGGGRWGWRMDLHIDLAGGELTVIVSMTTHWYRQL